MARARVERLVGNAAVPTVAASNGWPSGIRSERGSGCAGCCPMERGGTDRSNGEAQEALAPFCLHTRVGSCGGVREKKWGERRGVSRGYWCVGARCPVSKAADVDLG